MRTPKEYSENLKKRLITAAMLEDCLYSVNKRAKNYRDNKREARNYRYGKLDYAALNEAKEQEFYRMKEELLSVLTPICIHKEFAGYERIRVKETDPQYYELMLQKGLSGEIVWFNSYIEYDDFDNLDLDFDSYERKVYFFDYVDRTKPTFRWYLYYQIGEHTFHSPIAEGDVEKYSANLPVVEIGRIITDGHEPSDLVSVQFVEKVLNLIKSGDYLLEKIESKAIEYDDENIRRISSMPFSFFYEEIADKVVSGIEKKIKDEDAADPDEIAADGERVKGLIKQELEKISGTKNKELSYSEYSRCIKQVIGKQAKIKKAPSLTEELYEKIDDIANDSNLFNGFTRIITDEIKSNGTYSKMVEQNYNMQLRKYVNEHKKEWAEEFGITIVKKKNKRH